LSKKGAGIIDLFVKEKLFFDGDAPYNGKTIEDVPTGS
jgi:hypothetical protein